MNPIAIRDSMLNLLPAPSILAAAQSLKIDAVELQIDEAFQINTLKDAAGNPVRLSNSTEAKQVKAQFASAGLRIDALLLMTDFSGPKAEAHIDWSIRADELAAAIGAYAIRIDPLTADRTLPPEKVRDNLVPAIQKILAGTSGSSIDLAMENHGPIANDPKFLDEIFAAIPDRRLGLTLDTGNFYWYGFPLDEMYGLIEKYASRARHTHLKNINYPADLAKQRRPIGQEYGTYCCALHEGNLDLPRVIGILRKAGYTRDFCIENERLGKYPPEQRLEIVQQEVNCVRKSVSAS